MLVIEIAVVGQSCAFFRRPLEETTSADLGMHPGNCFAPSLAECSSALLNEQTLAGRGHRLRDGDPSFLASLRAAFSARGLAIVIICITL